MRCPRGSPRLTSRPFRTTNAFGSRGFVSAAGMSTCQPLRSVPLNKLRDLSCVAQNEATPTVTRQTARILAFTGHEILIDLAVRQRHRREVQDSVAGTNSIRPDHHAAA